MRDAGIDHEANRWHQESYEPGEKVGGAVAVLGCILSAIGLVSGVVWWFA